MLIILVKMTQYKQNKERLENAVEAFFDDEKFVEDTALQFADNAPIFRIEESESFTNKNRTLINILKQVILFFPSVFFLFLISFAISNITVFNPFGATLREGSLPLIIIFSLLSFFSAWFGLGNLRKKEDISIPISIIGTGIILGIISGIISMISSDLARIVWSESYPLYLFPIALIAPNLVKLWIDSTNDK